MKNNVNKIFKKMKPQLIKLGFKLAAWLYNRGIIAPQLLEHPDGTPVRNIKVLTPYESEAMGYN